MAIPIPRVWLCPTHLLIKLCGPVTLYGFYFTSTSAKYPFKHGFQTEMHHVRLICTGDKLAHLENHFWMQYRLKDAET